MKPCPVCDVPLEPRKDVSVTVDVCPAGHGAWYERDELRQAKDAADRDVRWLDTDLWSDAAQASAEPSARRCPGCRSRLVQVAYGDTDVQVDACPSCEGVWLDTGEFERIVHALHEETTGKPLPGYVKASLEEALEILAGPESMVSEWKDFTTVLRLARYRLLAEHPGLRDSLLAMQRANPFQ